MVTSRQIDELDRAAIKRALGQDKFHVGTKADVFYQYGALTNVYEDEDGPIMLVRGSKSLRIDMLFFDNEDSVRNREAMMTGWRALIENAKRSGFSEIVTSSNSPALVEFGCKFLGFEKMQTEENKEIALRRLL